MKKGKFFSSQDPTALANPPGLQLYNVGDDAVGHTIPRSLDQQVLRLGDDVGSGKLGDCRLRQIPPPLRYRLGQTLLVITGRPGLSSPLEILELEWHYYTGVGYFRGLPLPLDPLRVDYLFGEKFGDG